MWTQAISTTDHSLSNVLEPEEKTDAFQWTLVKLRVPAKKKNFKKLEQIHPQIMGTILVCARKNGGKLRNPLVWKAGLRA
jgi:hypothetical protein